MDAELLTDCTLLQMVYEDIKGLCRRLFWKYWAFMLLVLASVLVTTYTDPLNSASIVAQALVYL